MFTAALRVPVQHQHPVIRKVELRPGLTVTELAEEVAVPVNKSDSGYHYFGNDWWGRDNCPRAFQYLSLDAMYPAPYFDTDGTGHPDRTRGLDLADYMFGVYRSLVGSEPQSVLELGSGGGEITRAIDARGVDYITVEGTTAGAQKLLQIGIPEDRIVVANLKFMKPLGRRFDLAMCTEVAEHLEPFFASKLVSDCIEHSDLFWFSAADRKRPAHYHHINEQPIEVWDNLFAHMGYPYFITLDGRHGRASRLYINKSYAENLGIGIALA